jgi:hypothetical protein
VKGEKILLVLVLACPGGARALAQGGPPLRTDDPGTPGDGVWEMNLAVEVEHGTEETLAAAPLLDLNYGLGERIQLKLEVPWVTLDEDGAPARDGPGNPEVGVKWRFLDQEPHGLDVSVYPQLAFNVFDSSADRELVERDAELLLPVEVQRSLGPFSVNPEVGYLLIEGGGDEWVYGLAAGWEPAGGIELIGEVHGEADDELGTHEVVFALGLRWEAVEEVRLLLAAGRGFRGSRAEEPEFIGYLGVQLVFAGPPVLEQ